MEEELITITKKEYEQLKKCQRWLDCLKTHGVTDDYPYELCVEENE